MRPSPDASARREASDIIHEVAQHGTHFDLIFVFLVLLLMDKWWFDRSLAVQTKASDAPPGTHEVL